MSDSSPKDLVLQRRILMFCGSGGVGKTTIAAATALWAAEAGRKVLVVTIDPAKRLANALGLSGLDSTESPVSLEGPGRLHAMMMDTKRVMDELIVKYAPTPEAADRILKQKIYVSMSDSMVGAQEVVALGKLYELFFKRDYDLIVVDTAPTKHAIDFFETPARLMHLFDPETLGWFLRPVEAVSSFGFGLLKRSASLITDLVERAFGLSVLSEIGGFFNAIQDLAGGFRERSERILGVLQDPKLSSFNIVTSPQRLSVDEALYIGEKLHKLSLQLGYTIVNRVTMLSGLEGVNPLDLAERLRMAQPELVRLGLDAEALSRVARLTMAMSQHDRDNIELLQQRLPGPHRQRPLLRMPYLAQEIGDLEGLRLLGRSLYGDPQPAKAVAIPSP